MRRLVVGIVCLAALLFSGCASEMQLATHHMDISETVTEGHKDLSKEHVLILEGNVEALQIQVNETAERADEAAKQAKEVYLAALENRQNLENLGKIALTVADVASGGRVGMVTESIRESVDKNRDAIANSDKNASVAVKELEGMSTEEMLYLVGAWATATGVGGALGKTGKSRASKEIDRLREEIARKVPSGSPTG